MIRSAIIILFFTLHVQAEQVLCTAPDVVIVDGKIKLNPNEKILVCGTDKSSEAWRKVPLLQARYQLNIFLQNRGYLNAQFELTEQSLRVTMGAVTETKSLFVTGTNGVVDVDKKRKIVGEPLVPEKLDEVKNWADLAARRLGHACPEITLSAQAWNQSVTAVVEPGPVQTIDKINRSGDDGLRPETLLRFQAFESGERYDVVKTQVTTDRILAQGLFQNAYITTQCHGDQVDLNLFTEVGKPRLLRFSVGGSTEEFPFVDVWYKDSRLDDRASSYLAQLHASDIRQSFEMSSEFYVLPESHRTFLGPRLKLERQKETVFESNKAELGGDLGRAWDLRDARLRGRVGPTYNYAQTASGEGPSETNYLTWDGKLEIMSHAYEAFSRNQFEGWTFDFKYSGQREGLGAGLNVDRYDLRFKHLYNVNGYSPPLLVIASRFDAIMIDTHRRDAESEIVELPIDLRIYYGGNDTIRGFDRQSLNNNGLGYLSAFLAGFEFRLIEVLPYKLEPFLLWDTAKLGEKMSTVIHPTFISYGAGVRWVSPFGTLRGSAARGEIRDGNAETINYAQSWNYFISFGQEF